jgi:hypothetical protein
LFWNMIAVVFYNIFYFLKFIFGVKIPKLKNIYIYIYIKLKKKNNLDVWACIDSLGELVVLITSD